MLQNYDKSRKAEEKSRTTVGIKRQIGTVEICDIIKVAAV